MKQLILFVALISASFALAGKANTTKFIIKPMATCTGAKNCRACKNCRYCKHCAKEGGTCGVCKKE